MAKYEDTYVLDCSIENAVALFHMMAKEEFPTWSISRNSSSVLKLKESPLAMVAGGYPTTVEVHLAVRSPTVTEIQLKGSCFGWGPTGHIKKRVNKMRDLTERAVTALNVQIESQIGEGVLCPSCGQSVTAGTRFCSNCGGQISKICSKCNHPNAPSAHFCASCGTELE